MVIYQLGSICRHGHTANLNLPACRPQPAIFDRTQNLNECEKKSEFDYQNSTFI